MTCAVPARPVPRHTILQKSANVSQASPAEAVPVAGVIEYDKFVCNPDRIVAMDAGRVDIVQAGNELQGRCSSVAQRLIA